MVQPADCTAPGIGHGTVQVRFQHAHRCVTPLVDPSGDLLVEELDVAERPVKNRVQHQSSARLG